MKSMPKPRYEFGQLIASAYEEAQRTTSDPVVAAQLATATILKWLKRVRRPDLARQLCNG